MINPTSDVVNPYEFMNEQCAYLGDIQNCYYIANNLYIKKTFIGCTSVSFGKFIGFFEKYWHLYEQILYNTFGVFIRTEAFYISLENEWNNNIWDIRALQWILSAINNNNKMLDPNNFMGDPCA